MSTYATQSDVENIFGPANVAAWSLFETGAPSGAADTARIAVALDYADSQINALFIGGPYIIPLTCTTCQPVVTYWAAVIAGVWLFGDRATTGGIDDAGNRYIALRENVRADMDQYKAGLKRLDAPPRFPHSTAPAAAI